MMTNENGYAFGVLAYVSPEPGVWVVDLRKRIEWPVRDASESVVVRDGVAFVLGDGALQGYELSLAGINGLVGGLRSGFELGGIWNGG